MQVFKCALRIIRGNIIFLIVYIVGLSFMGIFMAQEFGFEDTSESLGQKKVEFAVVDRDHSTLSQGIADFLGTRGIPVEVEDSSLAFQDAVAKGQTDYLLIVPSGYEQAFEDAVRSGEDIPKMDVVFSYYSLEGSLVDEMVDEYLGITRTLMLENPSARMADVTQHALSAVDVRADVSVIESGNTASEINQFLFYMQWSTYTLFAGIVVCVGILMATLGKADVRRRNLASSMTYVSYNVQVALSCGFIGLVAGVWTFGLGVVVLNEAVAQMSSMAVALCGLSLLGYILVALAFGFMVGQLGANALICNAVGNIVGLIISFMGGAWMSLDLMTSEVQQLAHWLPGFWYTDACSVAAHIGQLPSAAECATLLQDWGVLMLFAITLLAVGFVAAKKRTHTSTAGGSYTTESSGVF